MSVRDAERRAVVEFRRRFGREPDVIASAPGRVNLIGEHIDYNGGLVMPMAVPQQCVAAVGVAEGSASTFVACDVGESYTLDLSRGFLGREVTPAWARYVVGVALELRPLAAEPGALLCSVASDVPMGGGLSSSAALEVSVAKAVAEQWAAHLAPAELAALCQRVEHRYAGVPCGVMDQMCAALGRPREALLIDCRTMAVKPLTLGDGIRVVVVDTSVRHDLAAGEYARRRACCESAAAKLGVQYLIDADAPGRVGVLTEEELRCWRHARSEMQRVRLAEAAVRAGDWTLVGELMRQSHRSLRDDYRVSCPELDCVVDALNAAPGVHGARMTGGGFGGCVVALAEPDRAIPGATLARDALAAEFGVSGRSWVL